jgi:hypothetical protein
MRWQISLICAAVGLPTVETQFRHAERRFAGSAVVAFGAVDPPDRVRPGGCGRLAAYRAAAARQAATT